jgi:hypothetical protein
MRSVAILQYVVLLSHLFVCGGDGERAGCYITTLRCQNTDYFIHLSSKYFPGNLVFKHLYVNVLLKPETTFHNPTERHSCLRGEPTIRLENKLALTAASVFTAYAQVWNVYTE